MKKIALILMVVFGASVSNAQTVEELKALQKPKKDSIAALQAEVDAIQKQIDAMPGWKVGAFGTLGVNLSGFENWYSKGVPNSSAGNIGFTFNGYANLKQPSYFWRNSMNVNLAWVKFDDKDDPDDDTDFREANDVFSLTSLYGINLSKKIALSGLAEYRTTLLSNFNDPGYLDAGVGATYTPLPELVIVVHPLNYNFVFSKGDSSFESSFGSKIVMDYTKKVGAVKIKSNFTTFVSYKDSDYSNWTWINTLGYTLWKGFGIGFDFGLRQNKQEALNFERKLDDLITIENVDNKLQSYWMFGLNYAF